MAISLPCAVSSGLISCAMACISSLVSAEFRLKNAEVTLVSVSPLFSKAKIVFSKVGVSILFTRVSTSALASSMPLSTAGT